MSKPENTPVAQISDEAIQAILAAGGVSDNSAQLHVHEEMNHLCVTVVGVAHHEEPNGFVMFCHPMG
jgi:hypothetical protein